MKMYKKSLCVLLIFSMLICFSACSMGVPKIKCGVYRSESSDAYLEVFEDNTIQIMNYDLSSLETILEEDTIVIAELNETDAEALRNSWNLNKDFANKRVKFEVDDEFYKHEGNIGLCFPINNPYGVGVTSWGITYYPAEKKMLIEASGIYTDDHVIEVFVLEK